MRLRRPIRIIVKIGVWIGAVLSAVHLWISNWGDWETAMELFRNRGRIMAALGAVLLAPWLWQAVALLCFFAYLILEHKIPLRVATLIQEPTAPTPVPVQQLGIAELFVLEPKAEAAVSATVPRVMAILLRIGGHADVARRRLQTAMNGFRPEKAKARNLQIYLDYGKAISADLPALATEIAALESACTDIASVYLGISKYAGRRNLSIGPYAQRARNLVKVTEITAKKIDALADSVLGSAEGQAASLDGALAEYVKLLQRFQATQENLAVACRSMLMNVGRDES